MPTKVDSRLAALGLPADIVIGIVGSVIVLVTDTQSASLITLTSRLQAEYSLTPEQVSWSLSSLTIAGAVAVPTLTRLGDRLGMRRLAVLGLVVSVIGNLLCAVVNGFVPLLIARSLLGLSAAVPLTYAILRSRAESSKATSRGVAIMTMAVGLGVAASFLMGGFIINVGGSVRTVFWTMTVLSVVALALAWYLLPDSKLRDVGQIDYGGAILLAAALVALVLPITEGNAWGWSSARVLALFAVSAALFIVWAVYEARCPNPLINLKVVFNRSAGPAFVIAGMSTGVAIYVDLTEATYSETPKALFGYGLSASVLRTAVYLLPLTIGSMSTAAVAPRLIARIGARETMFVSSVITVGTFLWLQQSHTAASTFVIANLIWGACFGLIYTATTAAIFQSARPDEVGMFSSSNTVIAAAIAGIGPGVFTAVLTSQFIPHTPVPAPQVYDRLWIYAVVGAGIMALLSLFVRAPKFSNELRTLADARPVDVVRQRPDDVVSG